MLNYPKFETWQKMGLDEEDWNQIIAAAEEDQHNDDDRYLEQYKRNIAGSKSNDEEATIPPSGTYASPDLGFSSLEYGHDSRSY